MFTDEGTVISAVLDGDTEAFKTLFESHRELLFRVILGLVGDVDQAEELTQEAFLRAFSHLDSFRDESRFSTWLVQIGIHLAHDFNRLSRRCGWQLPLDDQANAWDSEAVLARFQKPETPEESLLAKEVRANLLKAIARLPGDYREILAWKYFRDLSFSEIAEVTGESVGTLKVRAHRARQLLRLEYAAAEG
jgi:RNA polymerase sigma-70 factor (ECF subfamily)